MKKIILKALVFLAVFLLTLYVAGRIMNKDHDNLTMDMTSAALPVVFVGWDNSWMNMMSGYTREMDPVYEREAETILDGNRGLNFLVKTFGSSVTKVSFQVRTVDGTRLIEEGELNNLERKSDSVRGRLTLKDLIDADQEYALRLTLDVPGKGEVYYYTRIIWSDGMHLTEKLDFVKDFHQRLFDLEQAKELTRYLETNSKLEKNESFYKVNIHSTLKQITYGDLQVQEIGEPLIYLRDISGQTASFSIHYLVGRGGEEDPVYHAEEYYRIRYTTDRMYLLDYERTMTQLPQVEELYANDKMLLGIRDEEVSYLESEDGNVVVFEQAGNMYSYDANNNKLTEIYGLFGGDVKDIRTLNNRQKVKILDIDEGGNIAFAVYGYMNRGRHEGETGVYVYSYNSRINAVEELISIPYDKHPSILMTQVDELLYLNRERQLYVSLDQQVFRIDLTDRSYEKLVDIPRDGFLHVSESASVLVWAAGEDRYHSRRMTIRALDQDTQRELVVASGEAVMPLGFMHEDIIYGVARTDELYRDGAGHMVFPMYKICIANKEGDLLKDYSQAGVYVTGCEIEENQITLHRLKKQDNGSFEELYDDHITNNLEEVKKKNTVVVAEIDVYERYVQLKVKSNIDTKTIKLLTPKEVVFEGGRQMELPGAAGMSCYYVYGRNGAMGVFQSPALAVNLAYENACPVMNDKGEYIWTKEKTATKNQIMAIKETKAAAGQSSLAACLDIILTYNGIVSDAQSLLDAGKTPIEILTENLPDQEPLDMTGCNMQAMLYYVNRDIPVLALLDSGEAVLITGFNEQNVVICDPRIGFLGKKGMNDSTKYFEENGNCFFTYVRK